MLRRFRHRLFLLLEAGVLLSGGAALILWPAAWPAIVLTTGGAFISALACERLARGYLRRTLGQLRRAADDIGHGRRMATLEAQPGDDMYKLVSAINLLAARLARASDEERRLQEELRRRERMAFLGELAASVAHEINNPLDGVQNCARILRRSLDEPKRSRQMLDLIDGGLGRIELIVRRLLTLAREHVIRPTNASIFDIVASAKATVGERLTARRVSVAIAPDGQPDRASVDPLLLEHVYVNLFLNAADSMPDGGAIDVRIRRVASAGNDDRIRVEIEDSGAGVDPKLLPHIFEPFVTTKSDGKGTGLGLAIAARIVDAHHGTITVKSTVGLGTLFAVEIPALAPPDAPAVPSRDGVAAAVSGERGY